MIFSFCCFHLVVYVPISYTEHHLDGYFEYFQVICISQFFRVHIWKFIVFFWPCYSGTLLSSFIVIWALTESCHSLYKVVWSLTPIDQAREILEVSKACSQAVSTLGLCVYFLSSEKSQKFTSISIMLHWRGRRAVVGKCNKFSFLYYVAFGIVLAWGAANSWFLNLSQWNFVQDIFVKCICIWRN